MAGLREGVVAQSGAVEFAQDEVAHGIGAEAFGDDRVGDPALDVLVDAEVEGGQQAGPAHENEVVVLGEVLEEQPQLAQVGHVHEVGVVEDGGQRFAGMVEAEGLLDELAFTGEGGVFELDAEGVAEDFDGVGVRVQGACDDSDQVLVFGKALQGLFDDALARARNAEHQAKSTLLAMDFEGVVNLLLMRQEFEFTEVKGVLGQSVKGSDHDCSFRRLRPLATASRSRAAPMRWPL
jgi:hypothetical protein